MFKSNRKKIWFLLLCNKKLKANDIVLISAFPAILKKLPLNSNNYLKVLKHMFYLNGHTYHS